MQLNAIVMAMAGADRIFRLLDEKQEVDEGYVTLVTCERRDRRKAGQNVNERTGSWAWKHVHQADGSSGLYSELKGDVVFDRRGLWI